MVLEIEKNFFCYDKIKIIKKIKKMGGKYGGSYLFKVSGFDTNNFKNIKRLRVRDEGNKKTLTIKTDGGKYDDEYEINIDDIKTACKMLNILGFFENDYYEKIREIYYFNDNEFAFDTLPGLGEFLQIESSSEKELKKCIKIFELSENDDSKNEEKKLYDEFLFDFELYGSLKDRTFNTVYKLAGKLVKKNKTKYIKFIKQQMILYDKVK
jgi:predicted adenylyl cyclase CyaB